MAWFKAAFLTSFLSAFIAVPVHDAAAGEGGRRQDCRRGDRIRIQNLDVAPDPIIEGQRVRSWKVRLRFDGKRECDTDVVIREGRSVLAQERNFRLRPGVNEVEVRPSEAFRFRGREHCFTVQVDLEGTRQDVDADRRFCAVQRTVWSMHEPDERGGFKR